MEELENISIILKLLGDKTRLKMIACLTKQECCVCHFVDMFEMSQPAISQHLKKLKTMNIIKEDKRAQWVYYSINQDSEYYLLIKDIMQYITLEDDCCSTGKCQG